jgi:hypothetical protein
MNTDRLRDALRQAVAQQPGAGDRAAAAITLAHRRRNTRLVAASCATAVAALVASVAWNGASGTAGLRPVVPAATPSATPSPSASGSPSASPAVAGTASPGPGTARPGTPPPGTPRTTAGGPADPTPCYCFHESPQVYVAPLPVDVFLLVDVTTSMEAARSLLPAVVDDVADSLAAAHLVPAWGFGAYRDASVVSSSSGVTPAYELLQPITVGARPNLDALRFGGGDSNQREGATFGFDGLRGIAHAPYTTPDGDARFRQDAYRLVLYVTDAGIQQGSPYPDLDTSIGNLRDGGVHVAGLVLLDQNQSQWAFDDAERVAAGTGMLARRAADYDGDGKTDVMPGEPLVGRSMIDHASPAIRGWARAVAAAVRG